MTERDRLLDMCVMDGLADDVESLEDVLRMLNSDTGIGWHVQWGRHFTRGEIVQSLARLIQDDSACVMILDGDGKWLQGLPARVGPPASFDDALFGLTARGRIRHANWSPPDTPWPP